MMASFLLKYETNAKRKKWREEEREAAVFG